MTTDDTDNTDKQNDLAKEVMLKLKNDERFKKIMRTVDESTAANVTSTVETFVQDLASCFEMISHVDMKADLINALKGNVVAPKSSGKPTMNDHAKHDGSGDE